MDNAHNFAQSVTYWASSWILICFLPVLCVLFLRTLVSMFIYTYPTYLILLGHILLWVKTKNRYSDLTGHTIQDEAQLFNLHSRFFRKLCDGCFSRLSNKWQQTRLQSHDVQTTSSMAPMSQRERMNLDKNLNYRCLTCVKAKCRNGNLSSVKVLTLSWHGF